MSVQAITWAMAQRTGTITRKAVLMALANCHNHHTGRCCPKVETLALELDCSDRTVRRALSDLEEQHLITRTRSRHSDGYYGVYHYTLRMDNVSSPPDRESAGQGDRLSGPEPEVNLEPSEANASAQVLVREVVDSAKNHGVPIPRNVIGHLASSIKKLLDEGVAPDQIRAGMARMAERRLFQPSLLPNFVTEAAIPKQQPLRYGRGMTAQQVLDRYGVTE